MATALDRLDEPRLARYLEKHVPGFRGPLSARKFAGGQSNPTYLVEAASGRYVLRRKPPGQLLKSAHAVDREFRVLAALHGSEVPVAKPYHLCADESVVGSMFYLMDFVDGRTFWDAALPELDRPERRPVFDELCRILAALHAVDTATAGLADFGRPGSYFARQVSRWTEQYRATQTRSIPAMDTLIERLPREMPADDGRTALIHGDFRIDNVIFANDAPRARAILDWELSTLGHPIADLAYFCMTLRMKSLGPMKGLFGKERAALGIPEESEIVNQYCARAGVGAIDRWPYYIAFSFFRLAAILQGITRRALDGIASSSEALTVGREAATLAEMGLAALDE